jgi:hypothetical protein
MVMMKHVNCSLILSLDLQLLWMLSLVKNI